MFHYITPIYVLLILQDVLFTILFSVPPYNLEDGSSAEKTQGLSLASALVFNVVYCVLAALLVSLVFKNAKLYSVSSCEYRFSLFPPFSPFVFLPFFSPEESQC